MLCVAVSQESSDRKLSVKKSSRSTSSRQAFFRASESSGRLSGFLLLWQRAQAREALAAERVGHEGEELVVEGQHVAEPIPRLRIRVGVEVQDFEGAEVHGEHECLRLGWARPSGLRCGGE